MEPNNNPVQPSKTQLDRNQTCVDLNKNPVKPSKTVVTSVEAHKTPVKPNFNTKKKTVNSVETTENESTRR